MEIICDVKVEESLEDTTNAIILYVRSTTSDDMVNAVNVKSGGEIKDMNVGFLSYMLGMKVGFLLCIWEMMVGC
ncbi:hypothetical protein L2E82_12789 [Cichorium intybus]|uniref:Uncharacterized protein n=1 Tax=Cichorium intybus TaxID=13427 RepID=A0ACB9GH19_CICIN|nr:hypothetical protein L2E82_12789 [Cichorium intybus]